MKLSISLPDGIVSAIDEARGDVPRSLWIRRRLELEDGFDPRKKAPLPVGDRSPSPTDELDAAAHAFVREQVAAAKDCAELRVEAGSMLPEKPRERPVRVKPVSVRPIVQKK